MLPFLDIKGCQQSFGADPEILAVQRLNPACTRSTTKPFSPKQVG